MNKPVRNIKDLTASLVTEYEKLVAGHITPEQAKATSRLAGSILQSCMVQMQYANMEPREEIPFLGRNARRVSQATVVAQDQEYKPDFSCMVLNSLVTFTEPVVEREIAERMIEHGFLEPNHFEKGKHLPGGPNAKLRGTLLALHRGGEVVMTKNEEGRAVFSVPVDGAPAQGIVVEIPQAEGRGIATESPVAVPSDAPKEQDAL